MKILLTLLGIGVVFVGLLYVVNYFAPPVPRISTVITEMRELGRLETAEFTMQSIVNSDTYQGNILQDALFGDKILLVAHGVVVAGIDLSNIAEKDVKISGTSLKITLPAPILFSTTLDEGKTHVYDRKTGYLTPGETNLESDAQDQALESIRQSACDGAILEKARTSAKDRITQLYQLAGFTSVEVVVPVGTCK